MTWPTRAPKALGLPALMSELIFSLPSAIVFEPLAFLKRLAALAAVQSAKQSSARSARRRCGPCSSSSRRMGRTARHQGDPERPQRLRV
jgi:hypothetical protein